MESARAFPRAWIIGCGLMAQALVAGWRSAGVEFGAALGIDPGEPKVEGLEVVAALPDRMAPELVLLAVKPQLLDAVAAELATSIGRETVLVSIMAGVETASLRARFPTAAAVVRAMPNQPAGQRRGVIALASPDASPSVREAIGGLFGLLGFAPWVAEAQFDAVTALAGSGPAYVARFLDALAIAGEHQGLEAEFARRLAVETLIGTGLMAEASGLSGAEIARRVASPGGTTEAGLKQLDGALERLIEATIDAAGRRGAELAAAARG